MSEKVSYLMSAIEAIKQCKLCATYSDKISCLLERWNLFGNHDVQALGYTTLKQKAMDNAHLALVAFNEAMNGDGFHQLQQQYNLIRTRGEFDKYPFYARLGHLFTQQEDTISEKINLFSGYASRCCLMCATGEKTDEHISDFLSGIENFNSREPKNYK